MPGGGIRTHLGRSRPGGALEPGGERPELEGPHRRPAVPGPGGPQVTVTDVTCVANSVPVNVIDALGKLA